ncbi:MAG: hypothetical protein SF052_09945 [Bacteroidia bacterium]|nr:hypothetical protein [Bacteroidia bacterium]
MRRIGFLIVLLLAFAPLVIKGANATIAITSGTNSATVKVTKFGDLTKRFTPNPFYFVFIEWGDGMYDTVRIIGSPSSPGGNLYKFTNKSVTKTHAYVKGPASFQPEVKVSVTPVYSDDNKPNMMRKKINAVNPTGIAPAVTSYITNAEELKIFTSWDAGVKVGDTIQMVVGVNEQLAYTDGKVGATQSGEVYLYYDSNYVKPVYVRTGNQYGRAHSLYFMAPTSDGTVAGSAKQPMSPETDPLIPDDNTTFNAVLSWEFSDRQQGRELLFFVDFVIKPAAGEQTTTPKNIYWLGLVTDRANSQVVLKSLLNVVPDTDLDGLGILASKIYTTQVATSRDPNDLIVFPEQIMNGRDSTTLTYTLNFQNKGDAPENSIVIEFPYPAGVDSTSFNPEVVILRDSVFGIDNLPPVPATAPDVAMNYLLSNGKKTGVRFEFTNANLLGLGQFLINPRDSQGKIIFTMKTPNPTDCTEISAKATIKFGTESLTTKPAVVKCVDCGEPNYVYWCLVFMLILAVFLLAVWLITLKTKPSA